MKRLLSLFLVALFTAGSLAAQSVPAGWKLREDKSTDAKDPDGAGAIKLLTAGTGYHIETPTAAVFWNPKNTVTGNYTLKGTFTLNKRSGHVNFYGLVFGGSNLEGADQSYTYFLVAQDNPMPARGTPQPLGVALVKTRKGEVTTPAFTLPGAFGRSGAMPSPVVKIPDASGKSTNTLEVRVQTDKVDFVINGTVVHSAPRAGLVTDGIWGIRSNHLLDINVDGLTVTKGM
ncbi:MAG: hypothetical protein ABIZ49_05590 [Opitutaceae bacterium]